jgi:hypothetical protein
MALVANKGVREVEFDFYSTRSGLAKTATLTDHKAKFFSDLGYGSNASIRKPVTQMEDDWLSSRTGVSGANAPDKWREAVSGLGLTPERSTDQNKRTYLLNVA